MLKTINSGDPEFNQRDTTPGFSAQVYTTYTVCLQGCISRTVIHLPEKVFPWFCWMLGKILHSQSCSVDMTSSLRWEQLCILPLPPQTGMWATGVSQSPTIHPQLPPLHQQVLQAWGCLEKQHQSHSLDLCLQCKLGRNLACCFSILIPYLSSCVYDPGESMLGLSSAFFHLQVISFPFLKFLLSQSPMH